MVIWCALIFIDMISSYCMLQETSSIISLSNFFQQYICYAMYYLSSDHDIALFRGPI